MKRVYGLLTLVILTFSACNNNADKSDNQQNQENKMEQRISVLTIGADDLNAMKNFYGQVLGWTTVAENKDIAFYKLNGFLLSICDRKMLADLAVSDPQAFAELVEKAKESIQAAV